MIQTTKPILIRIDNNGSSINENIVVKQFDTKSRFLGIMLINENGVPYDLTGCEIVFSMRKPDGKSIFNIVSIVDAIKGSIIVELTTQALSAFGVAQAELTIYGVDKISILTSATFNITIQEAIRNENAVESTDEFTALTDLMNRYWDFHERIVSIDERIGTPQNTYDTFFSLLYDTKQSVDANTNAINSVNTTLGLFVQGQPFIYRKVFTDNTTFTVPNNVYRLRISGIAGGGTGGKGAGNDGYAVGGGGGGACGDWIVEQVVDVIPGEKLQIVVGTGNATIVSKGITLIKGGNGYDGIIGNSGTITGGRGGGNSGGIGGQGGRYESANMIVASGRNGGGNGGGGGGAGYDTGWGGNGGNNGGVGSNGGGGGSGHPFFHFSLTGGKGMPGAGVGWMLGGMGGVGYGAGGGGGASGSVTFPGGSGGAGASGCFVIEW